MAYCGLCSAHTLDMQKHVQTFDHRQRMLAADRRAAEAAALRAERTKEETAMPLSPDAILKANGYGA